MTQPTASPMPHAATAPRPVGMPPAPGQPMPGQAAHVRPVPVPTPAPAPVPGAVPGAAVPAHAPAPVAMPGQAPQMAPPMMPAMAPPAQTAPAMSPVASPSGMPAPPAPAQPGMPFPPPGQQPPMAAVPQASSVAMAPPDEASENGERALPSVTIHAFCERQETAGIINQSTRDWRMRRTNTKIYMGGLSAAIEFYRKENTPALVVIESGMRGAELFSQLEELAGVCDENTRVVVIGAANDIRLYRQLMEQGVSDYLVPPFTPLAFIRSIADLYLDPEAPFLGRSVAFFGAKGGVGSSTIAHNVAWQLSEFLQADTALVDLDASFGTTALDFKYDATSGLEEALAEPDRLDDVLLDRIMIRHTPRLSLLPASASLGRIGHDSEITEGFQTVVDVVRSVSPHVMLDLPHIWSDWTERLLTSADEVVLTATLDLACLRNTKNIVDFLKEKRPHDNEPILVVNMTGMANGITVEEFGAAVGLQPSVSFAFSPDVFVTAANEGEMISDSKQAAGTVEGFQRMASRIRTGEWPVVTAPKGGARSLLKSVGGKSSKADKPAKGEKSGKGESFIAGLLSKSKKEG